MFFILILLSKTYSSNIQIEGIVVDSIDRFALPSASILLTNSDSTKNYQSKTNKKGNFILKDIESGEYFFSIKYIGYKLYEKKIIVENADIDLGEILLQIEDIKLNEIIITATAAIGNQNSDTLEYNANSYKTLPNAMAEDLIKKIPGLEIEDGNLKAYGRDVDKILIDGKPFFSDDPKYAMKNLPASIISKIQVYDGKSDKAEFMGIEDPDAKKTINIITTAKSKQSIFGNANLGYGTEDKYSASGNMSLFDNATKLTITGSSNNGNSRSSGKNINHSAGINYNNTFSNYLDLNGSYTIDYGDMENNYSSLREYIITNQAIKYDNQNNSFSIKNTVHRISFNIKYSIDSNNIFYIIPNISLINNKNNSAMKSENSNFDNKLINSINQNTGNEIDRNSFSTNIMYKHNFKNKDRNLSINFTSNINTNTNNELMETQNINESSVVKTNRKKDGDNSTYNYLSTIAYIEPITTNSKLNINYTITYNKYKTDDVSFFLDTNINTYNLIDTSLTDNSLIESVFNKFSMEYNITINKISLTSSLNYQIANIDNYKNIPMNIFNNYKFTSILPLLRLSYKISNEKNLFIMYNTNSTAPTFNQLNNIINNSISNSLYTGNPELKQQYYHNISSNYHWFNAKSNTMFSAMLGLNYIDDCITNSIIIPENDTLINNSVLLSAGGELNKPINLDGSLSSYLSLSYSFPVDFIKSKLTFGLGINYSKNPTLINNNINYSKTNTEYGSLKLTTNIDNKLDITLYSRYNINNSISEINQNNNKSYSSLNSMLDFKWIYWKEFFIELDFSNMVYWGASSINENIYLLNLSIGKKLLDNAIELKLTANDILNKNNNTSYYISDYYIQTSRNEVPKRYFMLEFIYNFKN